MAIDSGDDENKHNRFKFKSYTPTSRSQLLQYVQRGVIALAVIVLLVLIGRQIHHEYILHHPSNSGQTASSGGNAPSQATGSVTTTTTHLPSSSPSSSSSTSPKTSTKKPSTLANTGPGNPAEIFTVVSLAGAGLHYLVSSRRQSQS